MSFCLLKPLIYESNFNLLGLSEVENTILYIILYAQKCLADMDYENIR